MKKKEKADKKKLNDKIEKTQIECYESTIIDKVIYWSPRLDSRRGLSQAITLAEHIGEGYSFHVC